MGFEMLNDTLSPPLPMPGWALRDGPRVKGRPEEGRGRKEPGVRRRSCTCCPWAFRRVYGKGWEL